MEKSTSEKIRLGVFVILGTALLVIAAYLIGNRQNLFGNTFTINVVFNNVNGLQKGNNVRYAGINVGTVSSIKMKNDSIINVGMLIDANMHNHIKKDAVATIGSDGLVGSMIVNIVPGAGDTLLVQSGDTIISYSRIGAEDMLSTLNVTNENAALLTADLLKVTQALKNGKGTLGRLLNDTLMALHLKNSFTNLHSISLETQEAVKDMRSFMNGLDIKNSAAAVLVSDSLTGDKMRDIITEIDVSSHKMTSVLASLDTIIMQVKDSKGAYNYLVADTSFVQSLEATMKNIESGTEKFNENMEALKHNFLTRRYFKKLEKEQQKENKD
jgi:phospholipid/cholesterol/gamma-HCH transport system substrate-binding protein